jgi:hypothetical protein
MNIQDTVDRVPQQNLVAFGGVACAAIALIILAIAVAFRRRNRRSNANANTVNRDEEAPMREELSDEEVAQNESTEINIEQV